MPFSAGFGYVGDECFVAVWEASQGVVVDNEEPRSASVPSKFMSEYRERSNIV